MTQLVFFRRQLELSLDYTSDELPHENLSALIMILGGGIFGPGCRNPDWNWDEYLLGFKRHLVKFGDIVEGLSGPVDYSCYRPSPQADKLQTVAQIMRAEVENCFETLRWEAMPDYGLEVLFS